MNIPADTPQMEAHELHDLFAHLPCGVLVAQAPSGNPLYCNPALAEFLPRPQDPPLHAGRHARYLENVRRPDGSRCRAQDYPVARALGGETVAPEELLYEEAPGKRLFFTLSAIPIRDQAGTVARVYATFINISSCRQAERTLYERQEKLTFALGSASLMLWSLDVASGEGSVDPGQDSLLGYQPDEIKPGINSFLSITHIDDKQALLDCWHDYLERNAPLLDTICRLRTRDGAWKWVQIRARTSEHDQNGRPLRVDGLLLDIDKLKRAELALRDSEQQFRSTFGQAAIGIANLACSGRWLGMNPKMAAIFGYDSEARLCAERRNIRELIHPADAALFETMLLRLLDGEIPSMQLEQRCLRQDGSVIWAELAVSCVRNEEGRIRRLICFVDDRTPRKIAEQQRDQAQAHLRLATRIAQLAFWDWNVQTGEVYHSDEWKTQLGYSTREMHAWKDNWLERIHPDDRERVAQYFHDFIAAPDGEYALEYRVRHKNGSYRWFSVRGMPVFDEHGKLLRLLGTQYDVTEQKRAQEEIRRMAQHDALTGLPNRGLLHEFAQHLLAASRRARAALAVLFFDIDRFKEINDTYGHKTGDGVLKEVALRLGRLMRAEDIIGRLGGDEFVAVLPRIGGREDAEVVAAKALELLGRRYTIEGVELTLSPSIGISLFPDDGKDIETLIQHADAAMYQVKNSGCNNYRFFTPAARSDAESYLNLKARLRQGLEQGRFELHYQPVRDTRSGALLCVEALLRWPDADGEAVGPPLWIATAEATGLIGALGTWIIEQACRQHREWLQQGLPPISISINLSPLQLCARELDASLERTTHAFDIDPARLEIEVAESAVVKNFESVMVALQSIKAHGFRIAIDHFGAGNSNLQKLSQLPIDTLKLDRAFLPHLIDDRASLAIAETAFALGRALGINVIAAGVESESDVVLLQQHACYHGQGFHLGRPMPGARFLQWYRQQQMQ